jgi:hypothetical protein
MPDRTLLRDDPEATRTTASGLFEPAPTVTVGDHIESGDQLGTVYAPSTFERRHIVTATEGGILYSLTREGVVYAGERLASVARPV